MRQKQRQRAEYRQRGIKEPPRLTSQPDRAPKGCREPSVYTIEFHRAVREQLCDACTHYLHTFS